MNIDIGEVIGLIGMVTAAGVLCLSYLGAFMLGHARGRREAEQERRDEALAVGQVDHADRLMMVEGAIGSVAQAVERLTDAQRLVLLERARAAASADQRVSARIPQHNTPA